MDNGVLKEGVMHRADVNVAQWSESGERIITCDTGGGVVVWKVDVRGRMSVVCQMRMKEAVKGVWLLGGGGGGRKEKITQFVMLTHPGTLHLGTDTNHLTTLHVSNNPIATVVAVPNNILLFANSSLQTLSNVPNTKEWAITSELKLTQTARWVTQLEEGAAWVVGNRCWVWIQGEVDVLDTAGNVTAICPWSVNGGMGVLEATGQVGFWLWKGQWEMVERIDLGIGSVKEMMFSSTTLIFLIEDQLTLLTHTPLITHQHGPLIASSSSNGVRILTGHDGKFTEINFGLKKGVKGFALSGKRVAAWDGEEVEVAYIDRDREGVESARTMHDASKEPLSHVAVWNESRDRQEPSLKYMSPSMHVAVDDQSVYCGSANGIAVWGKRDMNIEWTAGEGECIDIVVRDGVLCVLTSKGYLKLYSLPLTATSNSPQTNVQLPFDFLAHQDSGSFQLRFAPSSTVECFAFIPTENARYTEQKLWVYDLPNERMLEKNFGKDEKLISLFWDWNDSRVLLVQTSNAVHTIFVINASLHHHSSAPLHEHHVLVGVYLPSLYFLDPTTDTLRCEPHSTLHPQLLSFTIALHTSIDQPPLPNVANETIMELARMALTIGRLEVVKACLAKVGDVEGIRLLSEGWSGMVVLGMQDDLVADLDPLRLLKYQVATAAFPEALQTAHQHSRIHVKTTFYQYAQYLAETGDVAGAVAAYEKAGAKRFETPRLLLRSPPDLEKYIQTTPSPLLKKWAADLSSSYAVPNFQMYEEAGDVLSIVRLHCGNGNIEDAIEVVQRINGKEDDRIRKAGELIIARWYETAGKYTAKIAEAVRHYTEAGYISHAVRLAKGHNLDEELMRLALIAPKEAMLDVARYYEGLSPTHLPLAITLYLKCGHLPRALDLALTHRPDILPDLADNLPASVDAGSLDRCIEVLVKTAKYEKAGAMMVASGRVEDALELFGRVKVLLTEQVAENMLLNVGEDKKLEVLKGVGELAARQGSWVLASKYYTKAGDRPRALQCLLHSGDLDKILFFASHSGSKNPEIFVQTANYLQTLDWRHNPTVMKSIVTFYTKAKAYTSLCDFYASCAQLEIDEYQNYAKALSAYTQALKSLLKAPSSEGGIASRVRTLQEKIGLITRFEEAKSKEYEESVRDMVDLCGVPGLDSTIRLGDVYAHLITISYTLGQIATAQHFLEQMRKRVDGSIEYYLDDRIVKELGIGLGQHDFDGIAEEIVEGQE
ncbi:hypothetical protein HDU85_001600 [Gaertneriomyces sp. JEL0708]|nr:hypothetical protein HDU85_001600 [Gaertneriomyces sp. JEL0708]